MCRNLENVPTGADRKPRFTKTQLVDLLQMDGKMSCSDFHDQVYALLALPVDEDTFVVDYDCMKVELLLACSFHLLQKQASHRTSQNRECQSRNSECSSVAIAGCKDFFQRPYVFHVLLRHLDIEPADLPMASSRSKIVRPSSDIWQQVSLFEDKDRLCFGENIQVSMRILRLGW